MEWLFKSLDKNKLCDKSTDDGFSLEIARLFKASCPDRLEEENCKDSEYIFKTFDRGTTASSLEGGHCYVTLLEENRDIFGHGTTGLTSWQGALFLADWCQRRLDAFQV